MKKIQPDSHTPTIVFMNTVKTWGGGEKWHLDHACYLASQGDSVLLVCQAHSALYHHAIEKGLDVLPLHSGNLSWMNPFLRWKLYQLFRNRRPKALILNAPNDLKLGAPVAKKAGIERIVYRRGSAVPIRNTRLNRFLFQHCLTDVLANSEATKQTILQHNQSLFPEERIRVMYNGLTTGSEPVCEAHSLPVIGNLGRMVFQKRQDLLIRIAEILQTRGVRCRFLIGGDGPLMESLREQVKKAQLEDLVAFTGEVTDTEAFYRQIDVFALTSQWEGFGYVLAEAMLAGKPLVGFRISSNPELIRDGLNGVLVEKDDLEGFADALQQLVENPDQRHTFGVYGRQFACAHFDFTQNAEQLRRFLHVNPHGHANRI
jgi:glycosyltransferase involved in cell wall biosynthesis